MASLQNKKQKTKNKKSSNNIRSAQCAANEKETGTTHFREGVEAKRASRRGTVGGSFEMPKTSRTTTKKNVVPNGEHPGVEI